MHLSDVSGWHIRRVQALPMRPWDFALSSPESRAAARAAVERRRAGRKRIDVLSSIPRPGGGIHVGTWIEGTERSLFRFSTIPGGMTIAEAERIASQPGWKPSIQPEEPKALTGGAESPDTIGGDWQIFAQPLQGSLSKLCLISFAATS
jgi:hypothetical protein